MSCTCRKCVNYHTDACMYRGIKEKRIVREAMYQQCGVDCFLSKEDKYLCDIMCGKVEEDEI